MKALRGLILGLGHANRAFARVARWIALVLIGVMTAAVLVQVFFRYGLNRPISWTEEFAIFSMIWMAFLVAPIAYRSGAYVCIEIVHDLFKDGAALGLHLGGTAANHFPQLSQIATPGPFFFCGDVPAELRQAAEGMNMGAEFSTHAFGFDRSSA